MKTTMIRIALLLTMTLVLSACETMFPSYGRDDNARIASTSSNGNMGVMSGEPVEDRGYVGGSLGGSMDSRDRAKLSKALDNSLGKPTKWTNASTGVRYTVVPVSKTSASGNPFCRNYQVTASHGGNTQRTSGTACLGSDGAWHPRS